MLSYSVRNLITLEIIIKKVIINLEMDNKNTNFVSISNVYEDNNGATVVATIPRMNPTSDQISVKCYWFRQNLGNDIFSKDWI